MSFSPRQGRVVVNLYVRDKTKTSAQLGSGRTSRSGQKMDDSISFDFPDEPYRVALVL